MVSFILSPFCALLSFSFTSKMQNIRNMTVNYDEFLTRIILPYQIDPKYRISYLYTIMWSIIMHFICLDMVWLSKEFEVEFLYLLMTVPPRRCIAAWNEQDVLVEGWN